MRIQILKILGPFPTVMEEGKPPVDVFTVRFVYGDTTKEGGWQREGVVQVIGPLDKEKVLGAIKALLKAEAPHPLDGKEYEI